MKRRLGGFTLMETLVASGLALLVCLILAQTASNMLRAKRVQDEVSRQSSLQRTMQTRLNGFLSSAESAGIALSQDGTTLSIQPLARIDTDAHRQWAAEAFLVCYSPARKELSMKSVPFSEAGLTSSAANAVKLDEAGLRALNEAKGQPIALYDRITEAKFVLDRDKAYLSARVRREIDMSKAHKDEVLLDTAFSIRSSQQLRRRKTPGLGQ